MENDYKKRVKEICKDAKEEFSKNDISIQDMFDTMDQTITKFESLIPEFFSYNNGAAKDIKKMYGCLKELDYTRNRVIPCIDVSVGSDIYQEYYSGMRNFVENAFTTIGSSEKENIESLEKQIMTAKEGDPLFIKSIFGGDKNEEKNEELTEAVKNVEYLIDFRKVLNMLKVDIQSMRRVLSLLTAENIPIVRELMSMVFSSITSFCCKVIKNIFKTYNMIQASLNGEDVCEKKEENGGYKLF